MNSFCKSGRESDGEGTEGPWFQSRSVPLCSSWCVWVCSGQGSDPKNRAGNGESSSCEAENGILEMLSGTHPERLGLRVPRFCFSFFSPENFLVPGSHVVPGASSPPSPSAPLPALAQPALVFWLGVLFPALGMKTGSVPLPGVSQGGCESSSLLPGHFSPPGSLLNKANKPRLFPAQGAPCLHRIPQPTFRGLGFFGGTPEAALFLGGLGGRWWSSSPLLPSQNPSLFPALFQGLNLLLLY